MNSGRGKESGLSPTELAIQTEEAAPGIRARMRDSGARVVKAARRGLRTNPLGGVGLGLLVVIVLAAILAPEITKYDPIQLNANERLQPPSARHLFGTDASGRDLFSRVVYGSRISLQVSVVVLAIAVTIGLVIGTTAGYAGGLLDEVMMRVTDVFLAFPSLVLAMAVSAALGLGINSAMLAVAFTWWPGYARMIRSQVLSVKNNLYVEASRSLGAGSLEILVRHILPNCIGPSLVQITLDAGSVVLTVAGLSFIGLGAQPPTPEWGYLVGEGSTHLLTQWWWATFPGLAICLLVVGFNLVGDFLRDLLDPRLRGNIK